MFWKTVQPRISNQCNTAKIVLLTEEDMILKNEKLIADTLKLKKHPNVDGQSLSSITNYFKNN